MLAVSRRKFLAGVAAPPASLGVVARARSAQFNFKCASNNPVDHPATYRLGQMWGAIEQQTGGRLAVQYYPNGLLGSQGAALSQLRIGAIDFLLINPGNLAAVVPVMDMCFLGFAVKDEDDAARVLGGPLGAYMAQEATAKGLHVLRTFWSDGMFQIGSTPHPIRSVEDLNGFKIRVTESPIQVSLFKALGANPIPVGINELYTALKTKLVDGESASMDAIVTNHFYEVNKYVSLTNHAWSGQIVVANGEKWNSLPADIQELIERNNRRYGTIEAADIKADFTARLLKLGMIMSPVDQRPFRARLKGYYQQWAGTFGTTAWSQLEAAIGRRLT